jgi:hypothetical protein
MTIATTNTNTPVDAQSTKDYSNNIRFLTSMFNNVTQRLGRANRVNGVPNAAYIAQTEFSYLIHEITAGPACLAQRNIGICNEYLDNLLSSVDK